MDILGGDYEEFKEKLGDKGKHLSWILIALIAAVALGLAIIMSYNIGQNIYQGEIKCAEKTDTKKRNIVLGVVTGISVLIGIILIVISVVKKEPLGPLRPLGLSLIGAGVVLGIYMAGSGLMKDMGDGIYRLSTAIGWIGWLILVIVGGVVIHKVYKL